MSGDLQTALVVLIVGMTTVFSILSLVVLAGSLLIRIVNRFFPAPIIQSGTTNTPSPILSDKTSFNKSKLAAIVAAVDLITDHKGIVEKIERVD